MPVIVVTSGVHADDHADFLPKPGPNVTVLSDVLPMTPENNLAMQSAVIGKASICVGTYGGMTQFASMMRVPTIAYYDQWHSVALAHRQLSDALAISQGVPWQVLQIGQIPMLQMAIPNASLSA